MTMALSVCRTLSTLKWAESGSSTGKQLGEAAIRPLSVKHFLPNLFYAESSPPKARESPEMAPFRPVLAGANGTR
jgi:hypothetical protein